MSAVGMRDVARLAGVSTSTVSNVVNGSSRVNAEIAARVSDAIDKLGFVRNDAARQLRVGRTDTLGLVVINLTNPFFADLAMGVERAADAEGYSVLLVNSAARPGREAESLDLFDKHRVDGVLVAPALDLIERLDTLRQRGTPVVLIDRVDERGVFSSVSTNDITGGRLAAEHLLAEGCRRILYLGGSRDIKQMRDRLDGFRDVVDAANAGAGGGDGGSSGGGGGTRSERSRVELTIRWLESIGAEVGLEIGAEIAGLPADARPDAVFAPNDMLALGVIRGLTQHGLGVPGDVAVVGYDDIVFSAAAAVPLTSIRQPSVQMGETAARLLIEQLREPETYEHHAIVFEPELIVRASSARRSQKEA